ncbi:MAG: tetratricopeptide repeat protein [Bacteroidetes bacterium]|nr:MAG: tetratricopeptide repeat protein [Bacteroidota bacterium]
MQSLSIFLSKTKIKYRSKNAKEAGAHFVCFLFVFIVAFLMPVAECCSQSIPELEGKLQIASAEEKPGILNQLSEAYLKSDGNKSIDYAEQSLKAARKTDDINEETGAFINLGNGYDKIKNQKKAIQNYKEAIKLFDQYNQPGSSAYIWNKIADSYVNTGSYAEAIDANTKALDLFKKANDKTGIVNMNIDLGDIYFKQEKYESCLPNYKQALRLYEDSKDARGQVTILNRIGSAYSQWGNYDEAYIFLNRALDVAKKNNLNSQANAVAQSLEKVKKNMSNWSKSQTEYAVQAEKEQQKKAREQEIQILTKVSEINLLADKNIKSTAEIEQLGIEAQLKEFKIKTQQEEIKRKQMETESQTRANELLKKEKELADSELKTQRIIIWGGVGFSILGLMLTALVFSAYRNKKKANNLLKQKNEIIYKQKDQIEQKNMLITDSIDYAKNIQEAILPPATLLSKHFPESFILYKPKDVVSGDFYWIHEGKDNNSVSLAAADCTGHGVPGAFMSLLGFIMLDDIARRNARGTPAEVLKEVNTQLMSVLHQNTENTTGKFGMDIALIKLDKLKNEITFTGAHNPLIVVNSGNITEIKADRISIGTSTDCSFNNSTVQVQKGDMIYVYTDGYQDQIGGEKRKKFLSFHLKELLQQIYLLSPEKQMEELSKKHAEWKGKNDQTDDILIIGLKV